MPAELRIAVLVPCFNERLTIEDVVRGFRRALPAATIYVYDNNSTDGTQAAALAAGAIVRHERQQGKGHVVRRMFADVEADVYVLVDGDATYDASVAPHLVQELVLNQVDFVNAARESHVRDAYRPGHRFGNLVLTGMVQSLFGRQFTDMLSGYKLFSRRFVKSFPGTSRGFEIETELAIHALELRMPTAEVATRYVERPAGSISKLRTYRDGMRILLLIGRLVKSERPLLFFGLAGAALLLFALLLGLPVVLEYFETGLVARLPTAVLAASLVTMSTLSFLAGLILDMVAHARHEMKRLSYLAIPVYDGGR